MKYLLKFIIFVFLLLACFIILFFYFLWGLSINDTKRLKAELIAEIITFDVENLGAAFVPVIGGTITIVFLLYLSKIFDL